MKLTGQNRKLFNAITSEPWSVDDYRPLYESLLAGVGQAQQNIASGTYRYRGLCFSELSDAALRSRCFDEDVLSEVQWDLHGIARRFLNDDPAELARFGAISVRSAWLLDGHGIGRDDRFEAHWIAALWALAIGDELSLERMLDTLPYPLPRRTNREFLSNWPAYYPLMYDAVFALLRDEAATARAAIEGLASRKAISTYDNGLTASLSGMIEKSPRLVAEGLAAMANAVRKIRTIDPHHKLLDVRLHGVFQLCSRIDLGLTSAWDKEHALPWDADFHNWRQRAGHPLDGVELSMLPADFRERLTTLPIPTWWAELTSE